MTMAGSTIRLQTRTDYSMLASDFPSTGKNMTVIAARRIPVDRWRECNIIARVHAVMNWNAGAAINLFAALDPYTDEDPAAIWILSGNPVTVAAFTKANDTPPCAKVGALPAPFGPLIMLQWQFTMATAAVDMKFSVSIDLNLKGE